MICFRALKCFIVGIGAKMASLEQRRSQGICMTRGGAERAAARRAVAAGDGVHGEGVPPSPW